MSTELTAKQLQENRDVAALQQWKSPHSNPMPFDYWMAACAYAREETSARLAAAESKVAGLRAALAGARKGVSAVYSCASEIRRREAMIEAHSSIDAALKPNLP